MAIEQEELQLRVSLDDQASAQLAALRGQLDQMRGASAATSQVQQAAPQIVAAISGAVQQLTAMAQQLQQLPTQITAAMSGAVQGLQQVQTQLAQVSTQVQQAAQGVAAIPGHVAQGAQGMTTAIRQASFFGSMLGSFAGNIGAQLLEKLGELGLNLVQRATDFHGLAESMQDVQIHARGVGMSMTGYEGLQRQLQIGGMGAKEAQGAISRLADMQTEFQQYGTQFAPATRRLTQNVQDPETLKYMYEYMEKMSRSTVPEKINLINAALENIRTTMTARGLAGSVEGAQREFLEKQGLDPASWAKVREGYRVREELNRRLESPARDQMLRDRTRETEKFTEESLRASFYWEDIGKSLAASVLHATGLGTAMGELNTWLEDALVDVEKFEQVFRETGSFEKAIGAISPAWAPFGQELDKAVVQFKGFGEDLVKWNGYIQTLGTAMHDNIVVPLQTALTDMWNAFPEGLKNFLTGKTMHEQRGGAPPQITGKEPTVGERLDPLSTYNRYNELQRQGYTDEQIRRHFETQGYDPYKKPTEEPQGPSTTVVPHLPEGLTQTPQLRPLAPPERPLRGQRQSYEEGAGQPIIVSPADMAALVKSARPEVGGQTDGYAGVQLAGYKEKIIGEVASQLTTPRGLLKSGADLAETAKAGLKPEAPTLMGAAMSTLPFGLGEIPGFLKGHQEAGDPVLQWLRSKLGIPDADVSEPSPWAKGGAWHKDEGQPSEFGDRFGVWPGMGADKLDQTSSKLDQAANQNVNISGAGKIQVDVRAPPGTSVDAQGDGFFKSTEITRLTQMMPADMGPLPMTGVSTGQGVAGNGTMAA